MSERAKATAKTPEAKKENSASRTREVKFTKSIGSPFDQILFLQRTIGNQAVKRLLKSGVIQAKLTIGQPGDVYEQEADRVADQVMRMPNPGTNGDTAVSGENQVPHIQRVYPECEEDLQRQPMEEEETVQTKPIGEQITPLVQRQVDEVKEEGEVSVQTKPLSDQGAGNLNIQRKCGGCASGGTQCSECAEEDSIQRKPFVSDSTVLVQRQEIEVQEELVQTKKNSGSTPEVTSDLHTRIQTLRGGGQPLPESVRAYFEPRFGYDFGGVRIHTDEQVSETAKSINARAFTVGRDVAFGAGEYSPGTSEGKKLLAHELAHVVQQKGSEMVQRKKLTAEEKKEDLKSDFLKDDPRLQKAFDNSPLLKKNETSEGVKTLQRALRRLNYPSPISFRKGAAEPIAAESSAAPASHRGQPQLQRRAGVPDLQRLCIDLASPPPMSCQIGVASPGSAGTSVLFDRDSAVLTPAAQATVQSVAAVWHARGGTDMLRIYGYASIEGRESHNCPLSCRRAEAVEAELITPSNGDPGVPAAFIEKIAQGETDEFSPSLPPNRRAVITTTGGGAAPTETITSQTVATSPGSRTRTTIGVGEEVDLTHVPGAAAWARTAGTLSVANGVTTRLTAPDTAQRITVTGGTATISFDVIAPSSVAMDRQPGTGVKHTHNRANSGIQTRVFLGPDTVNFSRLRYRELNVPGVPTPGAYSCNTFSTGHCSGAVGGACPDKALTSTVVAGMGTQSLLGDCAYSGHCGGTPPFTPGSITVTIPYEYRVPPSATFRTITNVAQVHRLLPFGILTTGKAGAFGATTVGAPTVVIPACP